MIRMSLVGVCHDCGEIGVDVFPKDASDISSLKSLQPRDVILGRHPDQEHDTVCSGSGQEPTKIYYHC